MLSINKIFLLALSTLSIANAQIQAAQGAAAAAGACTPIVSTECAEFGQIKAKVSQAVFDNKVKTELATLKNNLGGAACKAELSSKVRYLKTLACGVIINEQACPGNTVICTDVCTTLNQSIISMSCASAAQGKAAINKLCSRISAPTNTCLAYYNAELDTCGYESPAAKTTFCQTNATSKCCGGTGTIGTAGNTGATTNTNAASPTKPTPDSSKTSSSTAKASKKKESKDKGGSFFTSKTFFIILGVLAFIIALLSYFYYVGSKDEKEEQMRNLENGNKSNTYENNNYGGTQTVEVNKNQNLTPDNNDYSYNNENAAYGNNTANPFSDNNQVDPVNSYNYNQSYDKSYNEVQNNGNYQNQDLAVPRDAQNPFESPQLEIQVPEDDIEAQINRSMNELRKNFPADDMPTPSVVKITEIEKPKQSNTNEDDGTKKNNDDDILKPSMVRMTNIETPVPTNTIPTDKDIEIGDNVVLKPSMVTLTEIQSPPETSFNNEEATKKDETTAEEPTKAVVNMIDLKTPSSNEALNAGNLLTPSIMITSTDGKTSEGLSQDEEIPEEYSEMPEPRPFRAIHPYEPQIDDELRLDMDNEIDVLYEYDDGWCWAINKTTGEQGACPLLCLVSAQEEASGEREWEKEMDVMKVPGRRESMLSNSFDPNRLSFAKK